MQFISHLRNITLFATAVVVFLMTSCSSATYVYQNGTTYNDYEVATNYRVKSATKNNKVQYSKAPNWKKISKQSKTQRYSWY